MRWWWLLVVVLAACASQPAQPTGAQPVDQAWLASVRMAAHRVYLRIHASRQLGVSRAFVGEHLVS
jgi:hypothetical protein